jgi:hypothetical protein
MSQEAFIAAARVTVAFCLILTASLLYQGLLKIRLKLAAAKKKERFERYGSLQMLPADRAVGNLLEWSVPFLASFWLSMVATGGSTAWMGWGYVACRAVYPIAAVNGGLGTSGPKNLILVSTAPAYLFLFGLLGSVVRHVL